MGHLTNHPGLDCALSFLLLWISTRIGASLLRRRLPLRPGAREDFGLIIAATLTLLGLLLGFSFSLATSRYDQRKNYEEAEASTISSEYIRASLLPDTEAAKMRALLKQYLDERVAFYSSDDESQAEQIEARTAQLQKELWAAVVTAVKAQPGPITGLIVSGMSDVLNSHGYARAAWGNRIPIVAWVLMVMIAICCSALIGYGAQNIAAGGILLLVQPFVVSVTLALIADIDAPRGGLIRVNPQNLVDLVKTLQAD